MTRLRSLTIDQKAVWILFLLGALAGSASLATAPWYGDWIEVYFPALFAAVFGVLCFFAFRGPGSVRSGSRNRTATLFSFSVFLVMLGFRLYYAHFRAPSLWVDEDLQLITALRIPPVAAGVCGLQPPLEYSLSHWVMRIVGVSEISARLDAIVFSALATALLCEFCLTVAGGALIALAVGAIFSFHATVVHYGFEARPYSTVLVTAMPVLWASWRFLSGGERTRQDWVYGCAAALLCLFSIGQQPAFLLLSLTLVTAFFPGISWRSRLWIASQWIVAVLLFLPIQVHVFYANHLSNVRMYTRQGHVGFAELIRSLRWENFSEIWRNFGAPLLFSLLATFTVFAARLWSGPTISEKTSKSLRLTGFFTAVAIVFLLTQVPFFDTYFNWFMSLKYTILAWLVGCVALAFACKSLVEAFGRMRAVALVLVGVGLWTAMQPRLDRELQFHGYGDYAAPDIRPDYRSALSWIRSRFADSGALVVSADLDLPIPHWLYGNEVYLKEARIPDGGKFDFSTVFDMEANWFSRFFAEIPTGKRDIVLLIDTYAGRPPLPPLPSELTGIEHRSYTSIDIYVIPARDGGKKPIATLLRLAEYLDGVAVSRGVKEMGLLPLLVYGYHALGNREMTRKYLRIADERGIARDHGFGWGFGWVMAEGRAFQWRTSAPHER